MSFKPIAFCLAFFASMTEASTIQIDFDGLVSGNDELNIFGLSNTFTNVYARGFITIDIDKLPSVTISQIENVGEERGGRAVYSDSQTDWLSITYEINGVKLENNHIFNDKQSSLSYYNTFVPAVGEHFFIAQWSESLSENRSYLSGTRDYIHSYFQLRSNEDENLIDGLYLPIKLPDYDSYYIGYGKNFWEGDGSITGLSYWSHFNFTSLNNIEWVKSDIRVPEPSTLTIFSSLFVFFAFRIISLDKSRREPSTHKTCIGRD